MPEIPQNRAPVLIDSPHVSLEGESVKLPLIDDYISGNVRRAAEPVYLPRYETMPSAIMGNAEIVQTAMLVMRDTRQTKGESLAVIRGYFMGLGDPNTYVVEPKIYRQDQQDTLSKAGIYSVSPPYENPYDEMYRVATIHAHPDESPPSLPDLKDLLDEGANAELIVANLEDRAAEPSQHSMDICLVLPTDKLRETCAMELADTAYLMAKDAELQLNSATLAILDVRDLKDQMPQEEHEKLYLAKAFERQRQAFLAFCDEHGLVVYKLHVDDQGSTDFIFRREQTTVNSGGQ